MTISEEKVKRLTDAFLNAYNAGDAGRAASFYAENAVYMPSHPGFGQSDRPEWLENMSDLACFYNWFLEKQGLDGARCIGFSLGGYLAAEMVAACNHSFSKLMLVDPVGIKPNEGEITDIFIISHNSANKSPLITWDIINFSL